MILQLYFQCIICFLLSDTSQDNGDGHTTVQFYNQNDEKQNPVNPPPPVAPNWSLRPWQIHWKKKVHLIMRKAYNCSGLNTLSVTSNFLTHI